MSTFSFVGPAYDLVPVTPSDATDLEDPAAALYIETGGAVSFVALSGETRTVNVPDSATLLVGTLRVNATGTTASGIHAYIIP